MARTICKGRKRDDSGCNAFAEENGYCKHHAHQEYRPEEAVEPVEPEHPEPVDDVEAPSEPIAPDEFRSQLASDLAGRYVQVEAALNNSMDASKEQWVTCPHCSKKSPLQVVDHRARLDAIKLWAELGFGKAQTAEVKADPLRERANSILEGIHGMTDEELDAEWAQLTDQELAAVHALELDAATPQGGTAG